MHDLETPLALEDSSASGVLIISYRFVSKTGPTAA
jgi:hypothetical protein